MRRSGEKCQTEIRVAQANIHSFQLPHTPFSVEMSMNAYSVAELTLIGVETAALASGSSSLVGLSSKCIPLFRRFIPCEIVNERQVGATMEDDERRWR
jgi:hypothetical protein